MRHRVAIVVVAVLAAVPPPGSAHGFGCGSHLVSDTATLWTHADPNGLSGVRQPSQIVTFDYDQLIVPMPHDDGPPPRLVWKASFEPTLIPVVFTSPPFAGCGDRPYTGRLYVRADNYYQAYLNGVVVAHCGPPVPVRLDGPADSLCFTEYQVVNVTLMPYVNQLVILAWNAFAGRDPATALNPSPAMIQYRLDY